MLAGRDHHNNSHSPGFAYSIEEQLAANQIAERKHLRQKEARPASDPGVPPKPKHVFVTRSSDDQHDVAAFFLTNPSSRIVA